MAAARKQYTKEFKQQPVSLIIEQGASIAQAALDLALDQRMAMSRMSHSGYLKALPRSPLRAGRGNLLARLGNPLEVELGDGLGQQASSSANTTSVNLATQVQKTS